MSLLSSVNIERQVKEAVVIFSKTLIMPQQTPSSLQYIFKNHINTFAGVDLPIFIPAFKWIFLVNDKKIENNIGYS